MVTTEKAVIDCPIEPAFPLPVNSRPGCALPLFGPFTTCIKKLSPALSRSLHCVAFLADVREVQALQEHPICDPKTSSSPIKKSWLTSSLSSGGLKHSPIMLSPSLASPWFLNYKLLMSPLSMPQKSPYIQVALYHRGQPSLSSSLLFLKSLFPFTEVLHLCKLSSHI